MQLTISIHDVWPGNALRVRGDLERLSALGLSRVALMVVPDYRGRSRLEAHPDCISWLRGFSDSGGELFAHGLHHAADAAPSGGRSLGGRLVNRWLTAGEAEFSGLSGADRQMLTRRSLDAFDGAGLAVRGFCVPTWYGRPCEAELRRRGARFLDTRWGVVDLLSGRSIFAPVLSRLTPEGAQDAPQSLYRLAASLLRGFNHVRVALHPGDLDADGGFLEILEGLASSRTCRSYAELFA